MSDPTGLKNGRKRIEQTESRFDVKLKMNQNPCYIMVFEKPSILYWYSVVSALTITFKNEQERKKKIIKTLMYWELGAIKVCLTAV